MFSVCAFCYNFYDKCFLVVFSMVVREAKKSFFFIEFDMLESGGMPLGLWLLRLFVSYNDFTVLRFVASLDGKGGDGSVWVADSQKGLAAFFDDPAFYGISSWKAVMKYFVDKSEVECSWDASHCFIKVRGIGDFTEKSFLASLRYMEKEFSTVMLVMKNR